MTKMLLALPLMMLAACDSGPDVEMENASIGEVASEVQKQGGGESFVNPGKWQQTVTLLELDAPSIPENARAMMKEQMSAAQVHTVCMTEADAKSPRNKSFSGADSSCRYEHANWGDGKVDLKMTCETPDATQTTTMVGTYSPDHYSMTMTAGTEGRTMKMKVDAKRIGDCDGEEKVQLGN